jgi:hypothetical protein
MERMWKEVFMAYIKAISQHLRGMIGKYGMYLVPRFLHAVSLFVSFLLELPVHIIYFQLCYQDQYFHMLVIRHGVWIDNWIY